MGVVIHPPHPPHWSWGWGYGGGWWWHRYHAPWVVGTGVVAATAPAVSVVGHSYSPTPGSGPCTCLTKQYLADGSVLFRDVCTKETAMATPDQLRAQAQGTTQ
jgi:hypothetical protein